MVHFRFLFSTLQSASHHLLQIQVDVANNVSAAFTTAYIIG